jgi:hypothetical protein
MEKRGGAVVFYIMSIAVLSLAGIFVLIMLYNPGTVQETAPKCGGTCEQYCESNEEPTTSSDCVYLKPICCIDIFDDPDDDDK